MSIEKQTVELLKSKKLKLATAESCTGGLISKRITDVSGSSEVFEGGVVCYSNRFKENVLGVLSDVSIRLHSHLTSLHKSGLKHALHLQKRPPPPL